MNNVISIVVPSGFPILSLMAAISGATQQAGHVLKGRTLTDLKIAPARRDPSDADPGDAQPEPYINNRS